MADISIWAAHDELVVLPKTQLKCEEMAESAEAADTKDGAQDSKGITQNEERSHSDVCGGYLIQYEYSKEGRGDGVVRKMTSHDHQYFDEADRPIRHLKGVNTSTGHGGGGDIPVEGAMAGPRISRNAPSNLGRYCRRAAQVDWAESSLNTC